ncbi:hypothetical protein SAMN04489729_6981 [Amycolatopsis lurida]|uniref:Uncharacterized protein n=1 Tax=Amycolatopsis lurida NRRL 2430 TaxID=1460371 RepID=A0A2P2FF01_AMYLU|nr:hypothetical protein [Amycolatopsis lurida]KFU75301.1 hypothetical protein BB31_42240 [Amycolatopsis lurida NRRL 2430]SEE29425.1 hypothetical protein SAMN04489729_6981 [Amycolatopsis lurida]
MPGNSLQDAVAAALNSSDQTDVIAGIKGAVISEIERLDPGVGITDTEYFNHSYAPDLVLTWPGTKQEREVYLRYNLRSARAARDVDLLGGSAPVFFSLDSRHDDAAVADDLEDDLEAESDTLVTNAPAIDGFTSRPATADISSVSDPLLSLFRRNVVRGGRGLLISGTAQRLQDTPGADDFEGDIAYLDTFEVTVGQMFRPDAATRLRRATDIVRAARTGNTALFDQDSDPDERPRAIGGKLELDELRILLPYLLERANALDSTAFWRYVGGMISLKQLEQLAETIDLPDLNRLVVANLREWRAARAIVSFSPEALEQERPDPSWTVAAKMLAATAGVWRVHFTADKRKGGSRDDSTLARWEDVWPNVSTATLSSVDMQGMTRRVRVSAEDGSNVFADVDTISSTIEDDFRVRSLTLRPTDEVSSDLEVDFKTMTVEARNAVLGDLASAAFDVLGWRYPLSTSERSQILGIPITPRQVVDQPDNSRERSISPPERLQLEGADTSDGDDED